MDRRVTLPKRVTSPTWGPTPPCKQALNYDLFSVLDNKNSLPADVLWEKDKKNTLPRPLHSKLNKIQGLFFKDSL